MSPIPENACLTPSEIVFLAGSRFVPKGGLGDKYTLLGQEAAVSKQLIFPIPIAEPDTPNRSQT